MPIANASEDAYFGGESGCFHPIVHPRESGSPER
jgi:hypothetical protein